MEEKKEQTVLEDHPLAGLLPLLKPDKLQELAESIKARGLNRPIVLFEGKILDGRNRYRACRMAEVEPRFEQFNGDKDPVDFVWDENIERRNLSESERIMAVSRFDALPRGNPTLATAESLVPVPKKTTAQAAKEVGVSPRSVRRGRRVLREASQEQIAAIDSGEKSVAAVEEEIAEVKKLAAPEVLDKEGYPIPPEILPDWYRAAAWGKQMLALISDARSILESGLEKQDLVLREITNTTVGDLTNAYNSLRRVMPYAVCTSCQGKVRDKCNFCKGRGYISEFSWTSFVPREIRTMREKVAQQ